MLRVEMVLVYSYAERIDYPRVPLLRVAPVQQKSEVLRIELMQSQQPHCNHRQFLLGGPQRTRWSG